MSSQSSRAVILIGHGGVPKDFPREKVRRLMLLEGQRGATGASAGEEELQLDREIRSFPRSEANDPYKFGFERLAQALEGKVGNTPLYVAYNEFCAPSVPDAVACAVAGGAREITLVSSMMTPGGSHAEHEIPELVRVLQAQYPEVALRYAWPFDLSRVAGLIAQQIEAFQPALHAAE